MKLIIIEKERMVSRALELAAPETFEVFSYEQAEEVLHHISAVGPDVLVVDHQTVLTTNPTFYKQLAGLAGTGDVFVVVLDKKLNEPPGELNKEFSKIYRKPFNPIQFFKDLEEFTKGL